MSAVELLPVGALVVDPTNPRPDPGDITELVESVRTDGVLSPLIVRPLVRGARYGVLCGSRRLAAAHAVGLTQVPCTVRTDLDDATAAAVGLAENVHRRSLDPIAEARAYRRMLDDTGCTQQELADRLGVSQPRVAQRLKLLELPAPLQAAVAAGEVTIASAYRAAKDTRGALPGPRKRAKRSVTPADLIDLVDHLAMHRPGIASSVRTAAKARRETPEQFIATAVEERIRRMYGREIR